MDNTECGRELWNILFHYNYFKKEWACLERDDKEAYFNGTEPMYKIGRGSTIEEAMKDKGIVTSASFN